MSDRSGHALPPTPDFDSYPVEAAITGVNLEDSGRVLGLTWSDGRISRYHAIWLRDNATDDENLNLETREQRTDVTDLPHDLRVTVAEVDAAGALLLRWNATTVVSRFHPGWLYAHDYSNPRTETGVAFNPRLWDAAALPEPPSFDGAAILEDDGLLARWLQSVCVYGIARLRNVPAEEGMVARVAERIGPLRVSNFGRIFDVRVQAGPGSNAYSSLALTPHSDLPTREYQPGLQLLHCLRNSAAGGRAVMVDGYRLAADLQRRDPKAYEILTQQKWPTSNRAGDSDYRWHAPVICLDEQGQVRELRATPFLRAPLDLPFDQVEEAYRSLRVFFEMVADPALQMRFDYQPGDLVLMDNRRLLHGRDAYEQSEGERWLQGCYNERDELNSRLRILARRRRDDALKAG